MAKSAKYEMVKQFYDLDIWPEDRVRNAVEKGMITAAEFKEITGKDY